MSIYNIISSSDSSFYNNEVIYTSMSFSMSEEGVSSIFSGSSFIELPNSSNYNFNYNEDFAISFYINAQTGSAPIIYKSGKTKKQSNLGTIVGSIFDYYDANPRYPYEIELKNNELYFRRFDGKNKSEISSSFTTGITQHVLCQKSGSELQIWITGSKITSGSDITTQSTRTDASVFIGTNGQRTNFFSGSMSQIMIFGGALTSSQTVQNLSSSYDNSPNIGNIVYEHGMLIVTKPGKYQNIFTGSISNFTASFNSSIEVTEQRYRCTIESDEFDFSSNPTALDFDGNVKGFQTSSYFNPYITSVGLYNEKGDLVAIGKMGQPVPKNKKIPTNFIIKYDM